MRNSSKGFTFVEIIIVLVIISILGAITVPSLKSYSEKCRFRSAVVDTVLDLQMAKLASVKINNYVVIQVEERGYLIFADNGAGSGIEGDWVRQVGEKVLAKTVLSDGISITSNFSNDQTRFSGKLGMKAGRIYLENEAGAKAEVVLSFNGRIRTQ